MREYKVGTLFVFKSTVQCNENEEEDENWNVIDLHTSSTLFHERILGHVQWKI